MSDALSLSAQLVFAFSVGKEAYMAVARRCLVAFILLSCHVGLSSPNALEEGFVRPPLTARPHTWFHMMNGNVTKEGLTRDFEAIAEVGLGGVQMFDAGCDIPAGPLQFDTPEWYDLMRHAVSEAKRLGLEICLPTCSGWSCAGGPWISSTNCMKGICLSETEVLSGPGWYRGEIPRPDGWQYRDVALVAYPVPPAEFVDVGTPTEKINGNEASWSVEHVHEFSGFIVRVKPSLFAAFADMKVEASENGTAYRDVFVRQDVVWGDEGSSYRKARFFPFDAPVRAKAFRLTMKNKSYGTIGDIGLFRPETSRKVADLEGKSAAVRQLTSAIIDRQSRTPGVTRGVVMRDTIPAGALQTVPTEKVVDLTSCLRPDGKLDWKIPPGRWRILRFGYCSRRNSVHPASKNGRGLEVDKLDGDALAFHLDSYLGKVCEEVGVTWCGRDRPGLAGALVDSYEAGSQNWTAGLERAFASRVGYDLTPYYPAFAGVVVGSVEETERFFEDFKRVVNDLFCENFADRLAKECHARGLALSLEPYGNAPVDCLRYGQSADMPMAELWSSALKRNLHPGNVKLAACIAHFWGRRVCAAESFTAGWPNAGRYRTTPYSIKAQGDVAYVNGLNRVVYHRFAHQPWTARDYLPGMTMGQWGMCYDRTQTWWLEQKEWIAYQSRCQWMLQEGRFVADVLYYQGEEVPNRAIFVSPCEGKPSRSYYPEGIDCDWCAREAVLSLTVDAGRLVSPGGMRYRLLVLPDTDTMSEEMLEKVGALLDAGAHVCAVRKPSRFPGLKGWPASEKRFLRRVDNVWAKGVLEMNAATALDRLGVDADVRFVSSSLTSAKPAYPHFGWIHRTGQGMDWYFVSRANDACETLTVSFRQSGKAAELWDAETGRICRASRVREVDGRTEVTFDLRPNGSMFVVFRGKSSALREERPVAVRKCVVNGPWRLSFPKGRGGPECVELEELVDWTKHQDPGVNYFSGTATYETRINVRNLVDGPLPPDARLVLDLGDVKHFASVEIGGVRFPSMWRPPFRVDVSDALRGHDEVDVKIHVTNLWPNRMIGDERQFEPDCKWSPAGKGRGIASIPEWVMRGEKSPTGRHTFCTWRHWTAEDELLPSGLMGPVVLRLERNDAGENPL